MGRRLLLDTTGSRLLIGLERQGQVDGRFERDCESHRYHSAMLVPAIEALLREAGQSVQSLGGVVVNAGPGSFTGIRTGILTARTLGQFAQLPVYVLHQFMVGAYALRDAQTVAVYLDALRGRAYHAVLQWGNTGFQYVVDPVLVPLSPQGNPCWPTGCTGVSPSLHKSFQDDGQTLRVIEPAQDVLSAMAALVNVAPERFVQPWEQVRSLYLQEPSVTMKPGIAPSEAG